MKKVLLALVLCVAPLNAAMDVREFNSDCIAGAVSVSTSVVTAIPTTALSGRNRIEILNADGTFNIAISTNSAMTFASGFVITSTASVTTARLTVNFPSGKTLYGLGQPSASRSVDVRILECK